MQSRVLAGDTFLVIKSGSMGGLFVDVASQNILCDLRREVITVKS